MRIWVIETVRGQNSYILSGCITSDKSESLTCRLRENLQGADSFDKKEKPEAVAVEELFFAANTKTAISVAMQGSDIVGCSQCGIPVFEYTPLQVKQAICGYGRGEKKQFRNWCRLCFLWRTFPSRMMRPTV
jgi:crossover junction endodeoxyribonuclease RuvC